ncbi:MAG TPA: spermidine/putrescine ABC transporter substrate-binding protein [Gaiellaceae bacterium]|nr:spermidine/putrescine ABC transporter substrate-binding protein [Gaiellaceae bacterium]
MNPFERINHPMTRQQLLRRAAVGGVTLSVPGFLAACGGGGGIEGQQPATETGATTVEQVLADEVTVSNWPFYIDQSDDATEFPTLDQFTEATGVQVNYMEDINSNEEFFGEIQAPLSRGQGIDRDIIVPTAWLAARLLGLGYLQKLDKSAIPNMVNLEDTLASPSWDPNRDYSLPWQSYITGLGYDPDKVGGELTSVEDLLDPALKGKITMLDSMEDTVGLFLLEMGVDPSGDIEPTAYDEAVAKVQKAVDDGQIRQFTGNDYTGPLAKGDVWAAIAWSGDIVILQADNPNLRFTIPDAGGMTSVDTMVIPTGGDVYTASTFMNFFYDPAIAAQVTAYVNYISPVKGTLEEIEQIAPELAEDPLVFPTPEVLENLYEFNPEAIETVEYQEKWQAVIGV